MGVAVNGMHFTGMYAMRVSELQDKPVAGFLPVAFLAPISIFVIMVVVVLFTALINRSGADDEDGQADRTMRLIPVQPPETTLSGRRVPSTFVPRPTR
jgi:hypothetical protein